MLSSAGIVCANSCTARTPASARSSVGHSTGARKYVSSSGTSNVSNRNSVTTPIDEPAPRIAQNRSAFSVAEQLTTVELASTTVAPTR